MPECLYYVLFVVVMLAFARSGQSRLAGRFTWLLPGFLHALAQLVLALLAAWAAARTVHHLTHPDSETPPAFATLATLGLSAAYIFLVNGILFGAYFLVTNMWFSKMHEQGVFSCQAITAYKSFLRIHITKERATIFPIGFSRPSKDWSRAPDIKIINSRLLPPYFARAEDVQPPVNANRLYDPAKPPHPQLIEDPIIVE
ncbi:MAG: hypothetical protein J2P49_01350 [Methylocapsa sp.]|nr:hypothetical protein [Methylocapsa sp.]